MRAILIDDEPLALRDLERQISKIGGVHIAATYYDAVEAIANLKTTRPQVVFIDIDMPDLNGLEAAEQMLQLDPGIDVVFVTAYEEYAVKAFDLNALDYLLKPLNPERLARTLERIAQVKPEPGQQASETTVSIRCFQHLTIEYGDGKTFHWRTTKAQELFAYLLYRRHQQIRKDVLIEVLWPHMETKKAYSLLYTTIYQLRKSIEAAALPLQLKSSGSGYSFYLGQGVVEVEDWENRLNRAAEVDEKSLSVHLELLDLYVGDYLADHDYPWAAMERERLRTLWHQHALRVSQYLQDHDRLLEAATVQLRILQVDPHNEHSYWTLVQLYAKMGDRHAVELYYRKFANMLNEEYGEAPTQEQQAWYEQWFRKMALS